MPLMNATSYVPQEDEPAMMTMADRTKAMEAHYGRLEREGCGQIVRLDDDNFWFVPSDPEALGPDFIDALTSSTMPRAAKGAVIAAAFINMEQSILRALRKADGVPIEAAIEIGPLQIIDHPLVITDEMVDRCARAINPLAFDEEKNARESLRMIDGGMPRGVVESYIALKPQIARQMARACLEAI